MFTGRLFVLGLNLSRGKSRVHRICKRGHAGKFQIGPYLGIRIGCGTPTRLVVTTVNPHRVQAHCLGRHMVVKQGLGHMQQLRGRVTCIGHTL